MAGVFDAPLPGQAMTKRIGDMKMDRPPTFNDPHDCMEYLFDKMTDKKGAIPLLVALRKGTPVDYLARTVVYKGVVEGMWTPDVAMAILEPVMWMICAVAKTKGIDYEFQSPDDSINDVLEDNLDLLKPDAEPKQEVEKKLFNLFGGVSE